MVRTRETCRKNGGGMAAYYRSFLEKQVEGTTSGSTVPPGFPETIPFATYAATLEELGEVRAENQMLRKDLKSVYDEEGNVKAQHDPSMVGRLKSLVGRGEQWLESLKPHQDKGSRTVNCDSIHNAGAADDCGPDGGAWET